jgi:hypothetical protein
VSPDFAADEETIRQIRRILEGGEDYSREGRCPACGEYVPDVAACCKDPQPPAPPEKSPNSTPSELKEFAARGYKRINRDAPAPPEMYEQQNQRAIEQRDRAEALLLEWQREFSGKIYTFPNWRERVTALLKERGLL